MEFDLGRLLTEESKRMMNCLHEGIFIADKMGNIVFANQALLEMAGGTEEYALSLNVFDFKKQGVDVNKDQLLAQRALETKRRITHQRGEDHNGLFLQTIGDGYAFVG